MIPKIINYCWFGGNPLSKLAKKCIKSWKKYCPDYKIIEWNESNFDISSAPLYVRQAYEVKKWAFVTDYIRLKVVYDNGGIYLDTDVEVKKSFDELLKFDAYFGFEDEEYINTGLGFGATKNNVLLYNMMQDYINISYIKPDNSYDSLPCPQRNSHVIKEFGFDLNGKTQIKNNYAIYSSEYFCPRKWNDRKVKLTKNTFSIHHFTASWKTQEDLKREVDYFKKLKNNKKIKKREERKLRFKVWIKKFLGESFCNKLKSIKRKFK